MKGLPLHPGVTGWGVWIAGLIVGLVYAWRIRRPVLGAVEGSVAVGSIVLLLIATGLGSAPFAAWRIVTDIRYTSRLDSWLVPRYGVSEYDIHPAVFDRAAALIPEGDTYYLDPATDLPGDVRAAFYQWPLGYLLPRIAVRDPAKADWILTLGVDPATVGPPVSRTWVLRGPLGDTPAAYLARVRR